MIHKIITHLYGQIVFVLINHNKRIFHITLYRAYVSKIKYAYTIINRGNVSKNYHYQSVILNELYN